MSGYIFEHEGVQYTPDGIVSISSTEEHNKALSRAELEYFMSARPDRYTAYVHLNECTCGASSSDGWKTCKRHPRPGSTGIEYGTVSTWIGATLGTIIWVGARYKVPAYGWPSTRQNLRIRGVNGRYYSAVYYVSSGQYCRMKALKEGK